METESDETVYEDIKSILDLARKNISYAVNFSMVGAYWNIGRIIVETQNKRKDTDSFDFLIKNFSLKLIKDYGKGFEQSNLRRMRQFYLMFPVLDSLSSALSWTHYRSLLKIENESARQFYINECIENNWSTRELERQITSFYYERLLSHQKKRKSTSKSGAGKSPKSLSDQQIIPEDIIKDPFILEFLGLNPADSLYEKDLEKLLIDHLQTFLLELGKGYSFVSRQKRLSFDGEHFYIDLVFYNYILKCFVLIDLKVGKLTHQDLGQMQMYVHYFTREMMNEGDNLPIGIVLCADKTDAVVRYTLPVDNSQIYASKYKLYLPTEEELKNEIETQQHLIELNKETVSSHRRHGFANV
ncbi:PDDEXK nuclease domain-containing protein [Methanolapillus millepedarum]|uniref:Nuclease YhcG n=1 Tax=Methanolapillus millepedarum TaxID=3028296 RepID=A0AA96V3E9_9EURY|nr:Putative nuclease YhcG [Methanosarcinaceae archaeon Ac7]